MFELCLIDDRSKLETIVIRFINCKKASGLFFRTSIFEEMIAKFLLNVIFHHVGMSWIISSNDEMKYNKGPWYNTAICSRLNGSLYEYFITHARTERYNIMCYLVAHGKKQPAYEDEEFSIGDSLITKIATTESLG